MSVDKSKTLLPTGFEDLLFGEAAVEAAAVSKLLAVFARYGYQRVKPPLLEFEESLFSGGPGSVLQDRTFRVMDPVSHKMMGLRPDVTAQIARISSVRLGHEARPLRVMYANDVFRTKAAQGRGVRQFCQAGFEVIGSQSLEADIEACLVALDALSALGVAEITLDLAVPCLVDVVLDDFDLSAPEREVIRDALNMRNVAALDGFDARLVDILSQFLAATGEARKALGVLQGCDLPDAARRYVQDLERVVDGLSEAASVYGLDGVQVTVDPVEYRGFAYHNGISMSVFAQGSAQEIGRGGRYDIVHPVTGERESATGFTFFMDAVRGVVDLDDDGRVVYADYSVGWNDIKALQDEGYVVKRGLDDGADVSAGCSYIFKNGKVEEI